MAVHDYHEILPGFSDAQILHDGCGECESRGKNVSHALGSLDKGRFVLAWERAAEWNTRGLPDVSLAERDLLSVLWAVQLRLETRGVPIGMCPAGAR